MEIETKKFEQPQEYEPFDPEVELEKLKKYDKKTKREKLEEYKKELIRQKEGIAEIQMDLEKQIRENPDLSQEELMKIVYAKAPEFRLSKDQLDLFDETLDKYVEKHQAIREVREKYPDNEELFKACFGKEPEGAVEIIEDPANFYFRCHNLEDYAWIHFEKFSDTKAEQKMTSIERIIAKCSGGCFLPSNYPYLIPSLKNAIIVENAEGRPSLSPEAKETKKHEEQHAIFRLYQEQQIRKSIEEFLENPIVQNSIIEELKNKKSFRNLIRYLRLERKNSENMAKDEILARYKSEEALDRIMDWLSPSGLYDYSGIHRDLAEKILKEKLTLKIFDKNKKAIEKNLNQVFVNEYQQEITKAVDSIEELEKMGKSKDEIISFLITEPLSRWGKLVERMKETKHATTT